MAAAFEALGSSNAAVLTARSSSQTHAPEKTHACDCCQNQMEHTEGMRGVRPMGASAVVV